MISPDDFGTALSRAQLQELCEFRLPSEPRWQLGRYTPPGPVADAYIRSLGPIDIITGPAGSGKTVASIWKSVRFSLALMPIGLDGRIRSKGTCVRDNYRSLYRSTLASWLNFFPTTMKGCEEFSGGQDRPAKHILKLSTVRELEGSSSNSSVAGLRRVNIPVDHIQEFFAIGDLNYELLFKSYETSVAWATEADGLDVRAIPFFYSRTGRYPSLSSLPPHTVRPRVAMVDFNPTDPEHPLWEACEKGSFREDFDAAREEKAINFFRQPGGLDPAAENRAGKTEQEYRDDLRVMPKDEARRMVHGLPGRIKSGLPVYDDEFDELVCVARAPLDPVPGLQLHIGFDQGGLGGSAGQPAAALFQIMPSGQVRVLAEVVTKAGTGVERFLDALVPLLSGRFHGLPPGLFACDPAGFFGGDKVYGTLAWADMVSQALGHPVVPAPTNEWAPRRESLALLMTRHVGGEARLLVDPRCTTLIKGLAGKYKYGKRHDGSYDPRPTKTLEANIVEALQYGVLTALGLAGTIGAVARGSRPGVTPLRGRGHQGGDSFNPGRDLWGV